MRVFATISSLSLETYNIPLVVSSLWTCNNKVIMGEREWLDCLYALLDYALDAIKTHFESIHAWPV